MKRFPFLFGISLLVLITLTCSGSSKDPVIPDPPEDHDIMSLQDGTHLWGMWDVSIDPDTETIESAPLWGAAFTENTADMVVGNPNELLFRNLVINVDTGHVDVDIGITNPLAADSPYTWFDVFGVFLADGPGVEIETNGAPAFSEGATRVISADGYTRWFNAQEFDGSDQNNPLLGFPVDPIAPESDPEGILNPYMYYASGLGANESAYGFIMDNPESRGAFTPGHVIYRHYSIDFSDIPNQGARFQFAILPHWAPNTSYPESPGSVNDFPPAANAAEFVVLNVQDNSTAYYEDDSEFGGNISLKISPHDWSVDMEEIVDEYQIRCYSTAWDGAYEVDMIALSFGSESYSAYYVDIPVLNLSSSEPVDVWIAATYELEDYSNEYVTSQVSINKYVTYTHWKAGISGVTLGPCSTGWAESWGHSNSDRGNGIGVDYAGNVYVVGQTKTGMNDDDFLLAKYGPCGNNLWGFTWGSADTDRANGIAIDKWGNVYIAGRYENYVDFNPGFGQDWHPTHGSSDAFVSKFDSSGVFQWAKTWGGDQIDVSYGVDVDSLGNVYVAGKFWNTVDFDPGPAIEYHVSNGYQPDAFLIKLDAWGSYSWGLSWGSEGPDEALGVAVFGSDAVYVTGVFTQSVDFNPYIGGYDVQNSFGGYDIFVSKYGTGGNYIWTRTWGSTGSDGCGDIAVDGWGNIATTGNFVSVIDLDPNFATDNY